MKNAFRALLKLHGVKKGKGFKLPRAPEPLALQKMYARRIKSRILSDAMELVRELLVPKLEAIAEKASRIATTDSVDFVKDANEEVGDIIDEVSDQFFSKWTRKEFGKVVRTVAQDSEKFQARALNKQLGAALEGGTAVDVVGKEPWLAGAIEEFTRENVALIRTIPEQFFSDLEKHIAREVADGARFEELAAIIEERYGVSEERAEFIARDQVAKFQGDLNRVRQTDLGIEKFTWRTVRDERVRSEHVERDGEVYLWTEPPDGETPGEPINCRCAAEPYLDELLE